MGNGVRNHDKNSEWLELAKLVQKILVCTASNSNPLFIIPVLAEVSNQIMHKDLNPKAT
jgi:hypothetical protein